MEDLFTFLGFFTAFVIVLLSTPALIKVAYLKRLVDEPGEARKVHKRRIPTIGGILIFAGTLFSFYLWYPFSEVDEYQNLIHAIVGGDIFHRGHQAVFAPQWDLWCGGFQNGDAEFGAGDLIFLAVHADQLGI